MSPYNLLTESSRMMMQQITRYQVERCQPDILIQMSGNAYDMLEFHHATFYCGDGNRDYPGCVEYRTLFRINHFFSSYLRQWLYSHR